MPPIRRSSGEASATKLLTQADFDPVPYQTQDVCTSISLLSSPENHVVTKALSIMSTFADQGNSYVEILYRNGVMHRLLNFILHPDRNIVRFALKLVGLLVTTIEQAAAEFLDNENCYLIHLVNNIFISSDDPVIIEFSSQILVKIVTTQPMYSQVLLTGTVVKIFEILSNFEDADCQLNALQLLNNLLEAEEAPQVIPLVPQFSIKTLQCYIKHKIPVLQATAFTTISKLMNWKCGIIPTVLKEEKRLELMLYITMQEEYAEFHTRAFEALYSSVKCEETATYFIKSYEFATFCQWSKHCPAKYILPGAKLFEILSKFPNFQQNLFDLSFEDALLSCFRVDDAEVFYKTCTALNNITTHKNLCEKVITPAVIQHLLKSLERADAGVVSYQEVALKTIHNLMKRSGKAVDIVAACGGFEYVRKCLLKCQESFTYDARANLLGITLIFASSQAHRHKMMNVALFEVFLNNLVSNDDSSQMLLCILSQYTDNSEYQDYFLKLEGPSKVLAQLTTTKHESMFKDVLVYIKRLFLYKEVGMQFLCNGAFKVLSDIENDIKIKFPVVNEILHSLYNLHLPLKFHKLGRLEVSDILLNRFYLIREVWEKEFPFLELPDKRQLDLTSIIYTVNFIEKISESAKSSKSVIPLEARKSSLTKKKRSAKRSTSSKSLGSHLKIPSAGLSVASIESGQSANLYKNLLISNCALVPQDPYFPKYVEKLRHKIHNHSEEMSFRHQVSIVAQFVGDVLSGPDGTTPDNCNKMYKLHIDTLKDKLGTNIIPIGYLRCGKYCERALLFKALADKVGIPATLVRGKSIVGQELKFWNEVPLIMESQLKASAGEPFSYMSYAVVDLLCSAGTLYVVGSQEAKDYCGTTK